MYFEEFVLQTNDLLLLITVIDGSVRCFINEDNCSITLALV